MKKHDAIIFDLDGTLWDASNATAAGWNAALVDQGLAELQITADQVRGISGLPFDECIVRLFGHAEQVDCESLTAVIDVEEKCVVESAGGTLFEGVKTGIKALSDNYALFLVSNCQSWYLESFWIHSGMKPFFQGEDCFGHSDRPKSEMIRGIFDQYSLKHPIYIGDTHWDQQASHAAGVVYGQVEYGFGQAIEPELSFSSFEQLVGWFQDGHEQERHAGNR
ncbi:MAG: HAD family hydrolase [Desulfuromonadales bacterium]|nr:HAD family hydrolase [Desulfuromonadales bacterium]